MEASPRSEAIAKEACLRKLAEEAADAVTTYVNDTLSLKTGGIRHVTELNHCAQVKYNKIVQDVQTLTNQLERTNGEHDRLAATLTSVDAFCQLFPVLERSVADLDAMITQLETTVNELCARQRTP